MFKSMIFTVIIALVSSLFVAIFLVPALAGHFLPLTNRNEKPVKNRILKTVYGFLDKVLDVITEVYRKMLNAALNHRVITILIVATLFIVSIIQVVHMNIIMMPTGQDSSVTLNVELPIGTTLEETDAVMKQLERAAMEENQNVSNMIVEYENKLEECVAAERSKKDHLKQLKNRRAELIKEHDDLTEQIPQYQDNNKQTQEKLDQRDSRNWRK